MMQHSGGKTLTRGPRLVLYKVALMIETAASSPELVLVFSQAAASGSQDKWGKKYQNHNKTIFWVVWPWLNPSHLKFILI